MLDGTKVAKMMDHMFDGQASLELSKPELTQAIWELKHILEYNMAEYSRRKIEASRKQESVDASELGNIEPGQEWKGGFMNRVKSNIKRILNG